MSQKTIKTISEKRAAQTAHKNRLVEAPASTIIEKTALKFAAMFYDAARSSGAKSTKTQKQWARDNFTKFIPKAVEILTSMLGRSDIADIQKQEIHQALLERVNDPEMVMLDELSEAHLSQFKFSPTE